MGCAAGVFCLVSGRSVMINMRCLRQQAAAGGLRHFIVPQYCNGSLIPYILPNSFSGILFLLKGKRSSSMSSVDKEVIRFYRRVDCHTVVYMDSQKGKGELKI